jgi:predicted dinucleotide-binding enzyme
MKKKIGIIGSGIVGQVLAKGFLTHGYEVMIGTNDAAKHASLKEQVGEQVKIGTFSEAAAFCEIAVLATKGTVAGAALVKSGVDNLKSKTVIDATNPIAEVPPVNGVLQYFTSNNASLMENLQGLAPETHFVKAFNSVGNAFMINPDFGGIKPTMFICGNSDPAKKEVTEILDLFGWETEDMGMVEAARAIEPLCILWCIPGFTKNQWNHAFKLLKK